MLALITSPRRNLNDNAERVIRGRVYRREKQDTHARPGNQNAKREDQEPQKADPRVSTADRLAARFGVSPATVKRDSSGFDPDPC
jgi:hypothetical protein